MTPKTSQCTAPGCQAERETLPYCRHHLASQGGHARAATLSPERRKEIATKASQARWAKARSKKAQNEEAPT